MSGAGWVGYNEALSWCEMDVTLQIPDEIAQRLKAAGGDLSRL
jgi:hypothetical protein